MREVAGLFSALGRDEQNCWYMGLINYQIRWSSLCKDHTFFKTYEQKVIAEGEI